MKRLFLVLALIFAQTGWAAPDLPESIALLRKNWAVEEGPGNIHAQEAWKITKGDKKIVVAVIDTGIDAKHPAIKENLWKKPGNEDEFGFDYVTGSKNPPDAHGHGTHVAGIIRSLSDVSLMSLRYYTESLDNKKVLQNSVQAIHYAIDNGANIINFSGEGTGFNMAEYKAIQRAEKKGILFVTAAGNQGQDNDESAMPCYPASYDLSNILTVAAINKKAQLIESSSWGKKHVHVAAPGERIFSSLPGENYGYLTGTSQATAMVTGVAALLLSKNPELKARDLKKLIMETVDRVDQLKGRVAAGGVVNAHRALKRVLEIEGDRERMLAVTRKPLEKRKVTTK